MKPATNPWVLRPKPNPQARLRLFCFPYAGGGASVFRTWSDDLLPWGVEVCPVQLPGRETRLSDSPFTQLPPLVQALGQALQPYLDVPFAFFGHSLGALIGFELARQLRRQRAPNPIYLFASGCRAPQIPRLEPSIHQLPAAEFTAQLRRLNGTPEEVLQDAELMQLLLPTLRADFAISETYVYTAEPPLDCSITAFGSLQDGEVTRDQLVAWRNQTCGAFSLRVFPGDHFFLHRARDSLLRSVIQDLTWFLSQHPKDGANDGP